MLGDKDAVANIAVKDLETAGKFYEGIIGLRKIALRGRRLLCIRVVTPPS